MFIKRKFLHPSLITQFFVSILLLCFQLSTSQNKYSISGTIKDGKTGEAIIGGLVIIKDEKNTGTSTNAYGFYSISLKEGRHSISFTNFGNQTKDTIIELNQNLKLNIELSEKSIELKEVEVSTEKSNSNITSSQMSSEKLNVKDVAKIPVFFGEKDILKTLQLLPGIKAVSDGNAGFYVRGGGADQNLILLDEATVYNPSHLLGFFSVFNSDAIKDVTIFKGGIPAEYGGRISSVLDVKMNDGNNKKLSVTGGVGLISSRLTIEAPIKKDKGSFIISGRRTYADLFLKLSGNPALKNTQLYFYDFNLKANYQLSLKDRIFLSGYFGRDNFNLNNNTNRSFGINWGNSTGTLRWNHLFNEKLFLNSSFIFTNYNYQIVLGVGDAQFKVKSGVQDIGLKEDFQYFLNSRHKLKFGFNSIYHTFIPGEVTTGTGSATGPLRLARTLDRKYGLENAIYLTDEFKLTSHFTINYGLRYSLFTAIGPGTIYSYDTGGNAVDSGYYKTNQFIKTYSGFEPRISAAYILNESSSLKASYNRIYQYLHLLSNTTSSTPIDLWVPCSNNVKPQIGDQYALGYFKNFKENVYQASVEVYYKTMQNQIDYVDGADLRLNKNVESQLLYGKGWAYGAEFFLKKKYGKLNGWIGYTIARSIRQFDGINNGKPYSAKQDIIHDISIVGIYDISPKWAFSATWVYHTGNAVTFPSGKYEINGTVTNLYTERNGYRMPAYHRMDVGFTWQKKKTAKFESSWNFSVYNVYGRANAYSISFQPDPNDPTKTQAVQLSLFRFVPSITYNFKF
jgi:hypothetical protein